MSPDRKTPPERSPPDQPEEPPGNPGKGTPDDDGLSDLARTYREVGPYLQIGWNLAASLALCTLGGHWLDNKLDTEPLFLILGALLGIASGFYAMFRTLSRHS